MVRWHADLQEYDYEIKHVLGKANVALDALSQPPGVDQGKKDNQGIRVLSLGHFTLSTATMMDEPTEEKKRAVMTLVHDHHMVGHPGRDKMI